MEKSNYYQELFNLYSQNAPAHKKLKQEIACVGIINKTDTDELSCILRLFKLAIFATPGRRKYYYRYFKSEIRSTALEIINKMINDYLISIQESFISSYEKHLILQIQAYLPLLTCSIIRGCE